MEPFEIQIKFLTDEAKKFGLPFYPHKGDAGFDLRVILKDDEIKEGLTIHPNERVLVSCGIAVGLPEGYWARITHRSSTEKRLRLRVVEGTIDQGYTGPLFSQIHNPNSYPITLKHGDRVAQMIVHRVYQANFKEVSELGQTERGTGGFGSTGKN